MHGCAPAHRQGRRRRGPRVRLDRAVHRPGRHVWRLAKLQTLGFSFGYLIPEGGAVKRADGIREIHKLDVFEITATPTSANADTRGLSTKALDDLDHIRIRWRDDMLALAEHKATTPERKSTAPVHIAEFGC